MKVGKGDAYACRGRFEYVYAAGRFENGGYDMTILADFNVVIGDDPIGVSISSANPKPTLGRPFNTGGRVAGGSELGGSAAFLICSVANINNTLQVFFNDDQDPAGMLLPSTLPGFHTQMVTMRGSRLKDGDNTIRVGLIGGGSGISEFFQIRELICFYHQDSD